MTFFFDLHKNPGGTLSLVAGSPKIEEVDIMYFMSFELVN